LSIATALPLQPEITEATKAKSNSRQMQEQTNITSIRNGDASPIKKPEPARVVLLGLEPMFLRNQ